MKLKAPSGVGDPCVAGAVIAARNGIYDVEAGIGALLIEAFGFAEVKAEARANTPSVPGIPTVALSRPRQGPPFPKLTHPAWRRSPAKTP
jgi:hypothetical protein